MATTPGALTKAILARLRGTEVLTGEAEEGQQIIKQYRWRFGTMAKQGELPHGNVFEDAGVDAMPRAVDVGILQHSVRRFEIWTNETASSFFHEAGDALEKMFDMRRGAPVLTIDGDGYCWEGALFTAMQAPFFDKELNAWYGMIAFTFLEARP
jgi:hypothetical protein